MENENQVPMFAKKIWRVVKWPLAVALVALLGLIVYWGFWPYRAPADVGFVYEDPDLGRWLHRTLWDWLGLLIIPAALAVGGYWLNRSQKETELKIAEKARENEQKIASDRQMQATLEAYYDRMTELLLEHKLRESKPDSEVRSIARARTIAVVRSLEGARNRQLFAFLKASKLIDKEFPIIDLSRADLSKADLNGVDLFKGYLKEAKLIGANLSGADLSETDLRDADLSGADLRDADLSGADMTYADLVGSNLDGTNLSKANLSGADLSEANAFFANMTSANLTNSDLSNAGISLANLNGAILIDAENWTIEQFDHVLSRIDTTMPDGVKLRGWEKSDAPTYDEWKAQYLAKHGEEEA